MECKEQFDSMKNKAVEYYSLPLTQKKFEELSRTEHYNTNKREEIYEI